MNDFDKKLQSEIAEMLTSFFSGECELLTAKLAFSSINFNTFIISLIIKSMLAVSRNISTWPDIAAEDVTTTSSAENKLTMIISKRNTSFLLFIDVKLTGDAKSILDNGWKLSPKIDNADIVISSIRAI